MPTSPGLVTTTEQLLARGFTESFMRVQLSTGRWQRLHYAVIATFSGPIPRAAILRGVVLAAGPNATLSHQTAAELVKLTDAPAPKIHVTIPWGRRIAPISGAIVHLSRRLEIARHSALSPSQTRIEATVFDLADISGSVDSAVGWAVTACGRRLTTPERLSDFLERRGRTRWRREWASALADLSKGIESLLELRYLRDVERAHGLPPGERQVAHTRLGGRIFDDVRYRVGLVVELDGRVAHSDQTSHRDLQRDNVAAGRGDLVLHFGWDDVTRNPCGVATQVARVLLSRGWAGRPTPCKRPDCGFNEVLESQNVI